MRPSRLAILARACVSFAALAQARMTGCQTTDMWAADWACDSDLQHCIVAGGGG